MRANVHNSDSKKQTGRFKPGFFSPSQSLTNSENLPEMGCNAATTPLNSANAETVHTLAQLRKKSRNKWIANSLVFKMVDLKSSLKKGYWNTYYCNREIEQVGKVLKSKYCNNRWCHVCNRVRTAKLINGYKTGLDKLTDPYFVTLSDVNVPHHKLKREIERLDKTLKQIRDVLRKRGMKVVGIRKIECTYSRTRADFHPHIHMIVEGGVIAQEVHRLWMDYNPTCHWKAQQCKPATPEAIHELFKYFTKMVTNEAGEKNKRTEILDFHEKSLDVIFKAMKGKRVFQSLGIKRVSENVDKYLQHEIKELPSVNKVWVYDDEKADWSDSTGNLLTGYELSDLVRQIRKHPILSDDWERISQEMKELGKITEKAYWKERKDHWAKIADQYEADFSARAARSG